MPKGSRVNIDWAVVALEVEQLPHGAKKDFIDEIAERYDISAATVYRRIKGRMGRKGKVIEGRATKYTDDLVWEAAKIQELYKTTLLRGSNRALSTETIIELMEEQGFIEPGDWSVSGLNAALRRAGYRDVKPRVRVEADYYCQQFQIDFSRSKHFQVISKTDDGQWNLRVSAKELHYKDGAARVRLWVTHMVDEYSRLRVIRYNAATGESPLLGISFLDWYFNRADDGHFMRHVPEAIRGDQGSFMKSQEGVNALEALEIKPLMASPENKETQGKVERGFGVLWGKYESRIAYELTRDQGRNAHFTLAELNRRVNEMMIAEQRRAHPVLTGSSRIALAQQSALRKRPRLVSTDVKALAFKTWERHADDTCMVRIHGELFEVPHYCAGKTVRIHRNMHGEYVGQMVDGYTKKPFKVAEYEFSKLGKFNKRRPKVYSEMVRDEVVEEQKVKTLAPKSEKVKPDSVFVEAEKPTREEMRSTKLKLVEARHVYARELQYRCNLDDDENSIPMMVIDAVNRGQLYNNISTGEVKDLAQAVADAIDARVAS